MSRIDGVYDINEVYAHKAHTPGSTYEDAAGNVFVFLPGCTGVDSTHRVVTYDEDLVTTLIAANAKGRVAVFMADADVTTEYAWAQIYGKCAEVTTDAIAIDTPLYIDATEGRLDDAAVTGDFVVGIIARSTDASTNIATAELSYPFVTDTLG